MATNSTESILLVGAGFLIIACIFFLLFSMVFAVKVPKINEYYGPLALAAGGETGPQDDMQGLQASDYSWLWIALLALSAIVMIIGAKLVYASYVEK